LDNKANEEKWIGSSLAGYWILNLSTPDSELADVIQWLLDKISVTPNNRE